MFRICSFSEEFLFYNFIINLEVYVYSVWSCLNTSSSFIADIKKGVCAKKDATFILCGNTEKDFGSRIFYSFDFAQGFLGFSFTTALLRNFSERKRTFFCFCCSIFAGKIALCEIIRKLRFEQNCAIPHLR